MKRRGFLKGLIAAPIVAQVAKEAIAFDDSVPLDFIKHPMGTNPLASPAEVSEKMLDDAVQEFKLYGTNADGKEVTETIKLVGNKQAISQHQYMNFMPNKIICKPRDYDAFKGIIEAQRRA